jgi:hypothetical protein
LLPLLAKLRCIDGYMPRPLPVARLQSSQSRRHHQVHGKKRKLALKQVDCCAPIPPNP